jgi:hypothetical protein
MAAEENQYSTPFCSRSSWESPLPRTRAIRWPKNFPRTRQSPPQTPCFLTVPNTLGVEYNSHVIENILKYVAPELGWR